MSLSPGLEEAELQQERFPALVPVSLRLPKVQCVHGQGQFLAAPSGTGGPAEPGCSQGGEDGLAQKSDTPAPSFYCSREFRCFQRPRSSCK